MDSFTDIILALIIVTPFVLIVSVLYQAYKNDTQIFPAFLDNLVKGDMVGIGGHVNGVYLEALQDDPDYVVVIVAKKRLYPIKEANDESFREQCGFPKDMPLVR